MAKSYYEDVITDSGLAPIKASDLQKKFDAATEVEYDKQRTELQNTENKFYNKLYDTQQTTMDTIRQNNASAVATGASKGIQAANELSALLGLQQESVEGATDIANKATTIAQDETQAMLENVLTAEQQSREANQALANILVQAGSVDVEGENADTAKMQVQLQWQQMIEQIRQTNPTLADELQKAYADYYTNTTDSTTDSTTDLVPDKEAPATEDQRAKEAGVLSGNTPLVYKGSNYKIDASRKVTDGNETVNKELDVELQKLGYKDRKDSQIKDGTTVTININSYSAAGAGIHEVRGSNDFLTNFFGMGLIPRDYTLTYYKGNWYSSKYDGSAHGVSAEGSKKPTGGGGASFGGR